MDLDKAAQILANTPLRPGVYIMRDAKSVVLYVGKASNLRNRLRSYFGTPTEVSYKVAELIPRVADFEYIVVDSEAEALLLENTLIKRHKPRFNIRLKDDKTYPYIKLDVNQPFPRLEITRRVEDTSARYFGPFASASSLRKTMALLKRLFPYRSCTKAITGADARPCLEYYIHRCVAPCVGLVDSQQYHHVIDQVILFLEGKHEDVLQDLKDQMGTAAEALQFERAATLRDQVRAIEHVSEEQKAVDLDRQDQDIIAMAHGGDEAWVEVFFIRQGKVTGRDHFIMQGAQSESDATILAEFIKQFYLSASYIPPLVLVQTEPEEKEDLQHLLEECRGKRVELRVPVRGAGRKLAAMVESNAKEGLQQRRVKWMADQNKVSNALEELQECLSLESPPNRVETYDISTIQGTSAVGSMVVFEGGKPKNAAYRRFKIRTVQGSDDYSMMQEMLRRRFRNGKEALAERQALEDTPDGGEAPPPGREWGSLPDLVLIDGGKGHLSAALEVMLELGLRDIPLASIAKQEEEIFTPESDAPIVLPRNSEGLYLVQRMRDEAHRFAITYHRLVRSKKSISSAMDDIGGIGPKRKKALLRQFGSVQAVREAPVEALAAVPGMTRKLAEKVKGKL